MTSIITILACVFVNVMLHRLTDWPWYARYLIVVGVAFAVGSLVAAIVRAARSSSRNKESQE